MVSRTPILQLQYLIVIPLSPESPEAQKTSKRPRLSSPPGKDGHRATGCGRLAPDSDIEILDGQLVGDSAPSLMLGSGVNESSDIERRDQTDMQGKTALPGSRIKDTAQPGYRQVIGSDSEDERQSLQKAKGAKAKTPQLAGQDRSKKKATLHVVKQTLVSESPLGGLSAVPLSKKYGSRSIHNLYFPVLIVLSRHFH